MPVRLCDLSLPRGSVVHLSADSGAYECTGVVHRVTDTVLYIEQCKEVKYGKVEPGVQHFNEDEIDELTVVTPGTAPEIEEKMVVPEKGRKKPSMPLVKRAERNDNLHLKKLHSVDLEVLMTQAQINPVHLKEGVENELGIPFALPTPRQNPHQMEGTEHYHDRQFPEFNVIRRIFWRDVDTYPALRFLPQEMYTIQDVETTQFTACIHHLSKQPVLGVSLEGQFLGRQGVLSVICFATKKRVFLFDVKLMGKECFKRGLAEILEDADIVKVFHDCRLPSDILFHQYQISLQNVFDTLSSHALFTTWSLYCGHLPKYAASYNNLVKAYFGVTGVDLFYPHYRAAFLKEDTSIWLERPLAEVLKVGAVRNVMHLLDLHWATTECMNSPCKLGTERMIQFIRDASPSDAELRQMGHSVLPVTLLDVLPKLKPQKQQAEKFGCVDEQDRVVHQAVGQTDLHLMFSRDCLHQRKT